MQFLDNLNKLLDVLVLFGDRRLCRFKVPRVAIGIAAVAPVLDKRDALLNGGLVCGRGVAVLLDLLGDAAVGVGIRRRFFVLLFFLGFVKAAFAPCLECGDLFAVFVAVRCLCLFGCFSCHCVCSFLQSIVFCAVYIQPSLLTRPCLPHDSKVIYCNFGLYSVIRLPVPFAGRFVEYKVITERKFAQSRFFHGVNIVYDYFRPYVVAVGTTL